MNTKQIHRFVHQYLDATGCQLIEKSPAHFIVKLSPQADRELTGRTYYWSFVDRTGAEPETMSFLFVIDKEKYDEMTASTIPDSASAQDTAAQQALNRSFGYVNPGALATHRMPRDDIHYGSKRLEQLFDAAQAGGSYVYLFQEPDTKPRNPFESTAYTPWLGVNIKVEFQCDRKREEFHSYGVSLATGHCVERFQERLDQLRMTPRLPPNVHIAPSGITLNKAINTIETQLERKLRSYDYKWAEEAQARLDEEQRLIEHYYVKLLESVDEERRAAINEQYESRKAEISWQFRPRVTASVINCGIFHFAGIE